jgi:hypothetical protein
MVRKFPAKIVLFHATIPLSRYKCATPPMNLQDHSIVKINNKVEQHNPMNVKSLIIPLGCAHANSN